MSRHPKLQYKIDSFKPYLSSDLRLIVARIPEQSLTKWAVFEKDLESLTTLSSILVSDTGECNQILSVGYEYGVIICFG